MLCRFNENTVFVQKVSRITIASGSIKHCLPLLRWQLWHCVPRLWLLWFVMEPYHAPYITSIESYVSNSHIGFDMPSMNVIKKTRPASNKTPDERMAYLVIVVVQEGNNKQFRHQLRMFDVTKPRGCREQNNFR